MTFLTFSWAKADKQAVNSEDCGCFGAFNKPLHEEKMAALLSGLWLSWRLSSEEVPILFSVIARLSLCLSLARRFYVSRPPSLSLVGALMLDDSVSWALSVEPCAPSAFRSPSVSFTVCISVSFEDHFYPTYFLLHAHKPPTPQTFQLFSLSFPFFSLRLLSLCPSVAFTCPLMPKRPHSSLSLAF